MEHGSFTAWKDDKLARWLATYDNYLTEDVVLEYVGDFDSFKEVKLGCEDYYEIITEDYDYEQEENQSKN